MRCLTLLTNNLRLGHKEDSIQDVNVPGQSLLVLLCIEQGDSDQDALALASRLGNFMNSDRPAELPRLFSWPLSTVTVLPFAHLSEYASNDNIHVQETLQKLERALEKYGKVFLIEPESTQVCFADLALFDTSVTSKLTVTRQSIVNHLKALLRVFSEDTMQQALKEAIGGNYHE